MVLATPVARQSNPHRGRVAGVDIGSPSLHANRPPQKKVVSDELVAEQGSPRVENSIPPRSELKTK